MQNILKWYFSKLVLDFREVGGTCKKQIKKRTVKMRKTGLLAPKMAKAPKIMNPSL